MIRRMVVVLGLIQLAWLAGPLAAARAGDLDGVWEREDKKTYRIMESNGVLESPKGEFGCRLHWTRSEDDHVVMKLRFTRTSDEGGWLQTTATSVETQFGPMPDELPMKFEWVDLDAKGKVLARGSELHTLKRKAKLADDEGANLYTRLVFHGKIDAFLEAGSPEYDPGAAYDVAANAVADDACKDDPIFVQRRKALERYRGTRVDKAGLPLKLDFVSNAAGEIKAKVTNATTRALEGFTAYAHPLGNDGKDVDSSEKLYFSLEKPLAPGASAEVTLKADTPSVKNAAKLALLVASASLDDGTEWERTSPPLRLKTFAASPVEVESLGLVPSTQHERESSKSPAEIPALRLHNVSPAGVNGYGLRLRFLAADGHEVENFYMSCFFSETLLPGAYNFYRHEKGLPAGAVKMVAEVEHTGFADNHTWSKADGVAEPAP